jgi:DNA-binding Lrp family transcriptional regulator
MIEAYVLVRVQPARLEEASNLMQSVKDKIKTTKGVKEIKGVFGRYDFVVLVNTETLQELGNLVTSLVRNIKGVSETETLVVGF